MNRHAKFRAVACRFWSIPPWEFDRACASGDVKLNDVLELVTTVAHDPTQYLLIKWLFPEAVERKKQEDVLKRHEASLEKALAFMPPQKAEE